MAYLIDRVFGQIRRRELKIIPGVRRVIWGHAAACIARIIRYDTPVAVSVVGTGVANLLDCGLKCGEILAPKTLDEILSSGSTIDCSSQYDNAANARRPPDKWHGRYSTTSFYRGWINGILPEKRTTNPSSINSRCLLTSGALAFFHNL